MSSYVINPYAFGYAFGAWTPANTSTEFWYDAADFSTITSSSGAYADAWLDKSGKGIHLTPSAASTGPQANTRTLNGLNVLEWSGSGFYEDLGTDSFIWDQANNPLWVAMVWQYDPFGTAAQFFVWHMTGVTTAGLRMSQRVTPTRFEILGGSGVVTGTNADNKIFSSTVIPPAATPVITVSKLNDTSSTWRVDGTFTTPGTPTVGTNSINRLRFGHNEGFQFFFDGFIAEVVGFTSAGDQEKVEGYFAWKWGLQDNLPVTHPYKNEAP